jgi:phage terminase small subunit
MTQLQFNPDAEDKVLNLEQMRFVEFYTALGSDTYGNATQSYLKAYNCSYVTAKSNSAQIIKKPHIIEAINMQLEIQGLNDVTVDRELFSTILQNKDLSSKMAGIREYNKLRKRVVDSQKQPLMIGLSLTQIFDEANKGRVEVTRREDLQFDLGSV